MLEDKRVTIPILAFIAIGLLIIAVVPSMWSEEKSFIINVPSGVNNSCGGLNELIMPQNMTDLCDVTIISPQTNQIIQYNGSAWINVNQATFNDTATCTNLGTGIIICPNYSGANVNIRSLASGLGISVNNDTNTITISNTGVLHTIAGSSISVNQTSGNVLITNTAPESTTGSNIGSTGTGVFSSLVGSDLQFKKLLAGTAITISSNSTNITISNNGVISNQCDTGINCSGTNPSIFNTDFANGTGISITGTTSQTFTNTGVTSLTSANDQIALSGSTGSITITPKYQFLCQTILGSNNATIMCKNFTAKSNLFIQIHTIPTGGTILDAFRFNNDAGNNYSTRRSVNGGAESTAISVAQASTMSATTSVQNEIACFMSNTSADEKLGTCNIVNQSTAGAGNAPLRTEFVYKWANTSNQITTMFIVNNGGTGSYATGSSLTIWGYD